MAKSFRPFCTLGEDANKRLVCLLAPITYGAREWGIALADIARHVAIDHDQRLGEPPNRTVAEIRRLFLKELDNPTDFPRSLGQAGGNGDV